MMKERLRRLIALLMAITIPLSGVSAWAELGGSTEDIQIVETTAPDPGEAPEPTETPAPEPTTAPEPAAIHVETGSIVLGIGEKFPLQAEIRNGTDGQMIEFKSESTSIAKVDAQSGEIIAKKAGKTRIAVKSEGVATVYVKVQVLKAPSKVTLKPSADVISLGQPLEVKTVFPSKQGGGVTIGSSAPDVIRVENDGSLTILGAGSVVLTAKTYNGRTDSCTIAVKPAPDGIAVPRSSVVLGVGQTYALGAAPTNDSVGGITYKSSDSSVAKIDKNGKIKAIAAGTAEIIVTTYNGHSATCAVTVLPKPKSVKTSIKKITLGVGETSDPFEVSLGGDYTDAYTVKTSKKSVASVEDRQITGVKKGSATITVKSYNGKSAKIAVTVKAAPTDITLSAEKAVLSVGQTCKVKVGFKKGEGGGGSFESLNRDIAVVDESGLVTAMGVGTAQITATSFNGSTASCTIEVKPAPDGVRFPRESLVLGAGQTYTLKAEPTNDSIGGITYSTSNKKVATVDANGRIKAVAAGVAEITAATYNGHSVTCSVTVLAKPKSIKTSIKKITLGVGETSDPFDVSLGGDYTDAYTVKSSKTSVATVEDHRITGVKKGSATITVKSYNGRTAKIVVTIANAPTGISLSPSAAVMLPGQTQKLKVVFKKGEGGGGSFESLNKDVATVDQDGIVTAVGAGTAQIVATSFNGQQAACEIRVAEPAVLLSIPESLLLGVGELHRLEITMLQADGEPYDGPLSAALSKNGIVTYSDGKLIAKKSGTVKLTLTAGELSATCTITVKPYNQVHPSQAVAHRGAAGHWPDNTLEAFRNVASTGADAVEFDVQTSKDGVQVLLHDDFVLVDGKERSVTELTCEELKAIKSDMCTLDEALELLKDVDIDLKIELKQTADGAACVEAVRRFGLEDRVTYISFWLDRIEGVRAVDADAELGMLFSKTYPMPDDIMNIVERLDISVLLPKYNILKDSDVAKWHSLGLKVGTWTLNTSKLISKYLKLGVDYIISDWPDLVGK